MIDSAAAIDAVVDAFAAFVTWAIEFIQSTLEAIFSSIIDVIKNTVVEYCVGVLNALMKMYDAYSQAQTIAPQLLSQFGEALQGSLYWVVFGLSIAINVALLALKVVTNVAGFLIDTAIGLIVGIIIDQAFNAGERGQSETASTDGVDSEGHHDIGDFRGNLESQGIDTDGGDASKWAVFWAVIGSAVSVFDLQIGYGAWHDSGLAKIGKIGLTLSGLSLALSMFSFSLSGIEDASFWARGLNYLSFLIGLDAMVISGIEVMKTPIAVNWVAFSASVGSTAVALGGLFNIGG